MDCSYRGLGNPTPTQRHTKWSKPTPTAVPVTRRCGNLLHQTCVPDSRRALKVQLCCNHSVRAGIGGIEPYLCMGSAPRPVLGTGGQRSGCLESKQTGVKHNALYVLYGMGFKAEWNRNFVENTSWVAPSWKGSSPFWHCTPLMSLAGFVPFPALVWTCVTSSVHLPSSLGQAPATKCGPWSCRRCKSLVQAVELQTLWALGAGHADGGPWGCVPTLRSHSSACCWLRTTWTKWAFHHRHLYNLDQVGFPPQAPASGVLPVHHKSSAFCRFSFLLLFFYLFIINRLTRFFFFLPVYLTHLGSLPVYHN